MLRYALFVEPALVFLHLFTAGPIPESFGGLMHLEELVLSGNALSGDKKMFLKWCRCAVVDSFLPALFNSYSYLHIARVGWHNVCRTE